MNRIILSKIPRIRLTSRIHNIMTNIRYNHDICCSNNATGCNNINYNKKIYEYHMEKQTHHNKLAKSFSDSIIMFTLIMFLSYALFIFPFEAYDEYVRYNDTKESVNE